MGDRQFNAAAQHRKCDIVALQAQAGEKGLVSVGGANFWEALLDRVRPLRPRQRGRSLLPNFAKRVASRA
jgi:hypothetical protein